MRLSQRRVTDDVGKRAAHHMAVALAQPLGGPGHHQLMPDQRAFAGNARVDAVAIAARRAQQPGAAPRRPLAHQPVGNQHREIVGRPLLGRRFGCGID